MRNLPDHLTSPNGNGVADPRAARQAAATINPGSPRNPQDCRRFGRLTRASAPLSGNHRRQSRHCLKRQQPGAPKPRSHPQMTRSPGKTTQTDTSSNAQSRQVAGAAKRKARARSPSPNGLPVCVLPKKAPVPDEPNVRSQPDGPFKRHFHAAKPEALGPLAFGRLRSSGSGVAEPDPDASYVAFAKVRLAPAREGKRSSVLPESGGRSAGAVASAMSRLVEDSAIQAGRN